MARVTHGQSCGWRHLDSGAERTAANGPRTERMDVRPRVQIDGSNGLTTLVKVVVLVFFKKNALSFGFFFALVNLGALASWLVDLIV